MLLSSPLGAEGDGEGGRGGYFVSVLPAYLKKNPKKIKALGHFKYFCEFDSFRLSVFENLSK